MVVGPTKPKTFFTNNLKMLPQINKERQSQSGGDCPVNGSTGAVHSQRNHADRNVLGCGEEQLAVIYGRREVGDRARTHGSSQ